MFAKAPYSAWAGRLMHTDTWVKKCLYHVRNLWHITNFKEPLHTHTIKIIFAGKSPSGLGVASGRSARPCRRWYSQLNAPLTCWTFRPKTNDPSHLNNVLFPQLWSGKCSLRSRRSFFFSFFLTRAIRILNEA